MAVSFIGTPDVDFLKNDDFLRWCPEIPYFMAISLPLETQSGSWHTNHLQSHLECYSSYRIPCLLLSKFLEIWFINFCILFYDSCFQL